MDFRPPPLFSFSGAAKPTTSGGGGPVPRCCPPPLPFFTLIRAPTLNQPHADYREPHKPHQKKKSHERVFKIKGKSCIFRQVIEGDEQRERAEGEGTQRRSPLSGHRSLAGWLARWLPGKKQRTLGLSCPRRRRKNKNFAGGTWTSRRGDRTRTVAVVVGDGEKRVSRPERKESAK